MSHPDSFNFGCWFYVDEQLDKKIHGKFVMFEGLMLTVVQTVIVLMHLSQHFHTSFTFYCYCVHVEFVSIQLMYGECSINCE